MRTHQHRRTRIAAGTAALIGALATSVALAAPGDVDTTFGTGGTTRTNVAQPMNRGLAVAVQDDGKVVVAGTTDAIARSQPSFVVTRYDADGTRDETFGGGDGRIDVNFGARAGATDLLLHDDEIVVAGYAGPPDDEDFAIARLTSVGALDSTFSGDGKATVDFYGMGDVAAAIARSGDDYVIAGTVFDPERNDGTPAEEAEEDENFGVAKLTSAGAPVAGFGDSGIVQADAGALTGSTVNPAATDSASDVIVQGNGSIVVGGTSEVGTTFDETGFALVRFTSAGVLDPGFDSDGRVTTRFGESLDDAALADLVLHDGTILAVGDSAIDDGPNTNGQFALARYLGSNGAVDTSFGGGDGKVSQGVGRLSSSFGRDRGLAAVIDPVTDDITVAGTDSGLDLALVRFTSAGAVDTGAPTFGTGGIVVDDLGGDGQSGDQAHAIAVDDASGDLLVTGTAGLLNRGLVARYTSAGARDAAWDADGFVLEAWGGNNYDYPGDLLELANGKLVASGYGYYGGPTAPHTVRYDADGDLDVSYGDGGIARLEVAGRVFNSGNPITAIEQAGGDVLLVTASTPSNSSNRDLTFVRIDDTGALDPAFGTGGVLVRSLDAADDAPADAVELAGGKIVVAATVHANDVAVARFHPDGALDDDNDADPGTVFGTDGVTVADVGTSTADRAVALVNDGSDLLLGARSAGNFALVRFSGGGARDTSYGTDGRGTADFGSAFDTPASMTISGSDVYMAGRTSSFDFASSASNVAVARFDADDGELDDGFAGDGTVLTPVSASQVDEATDVAVLEDGRVLVVGRASDGIAPQLLAVLYGTDGTPDAGFGGGDGTVLIPNQTGHRVLLQTSSQAVVFGLAFGPVDYTDFLLTRLLLGDGTGPAARSVTLASSKGKAVFGAKVQLSGTVTSAVADCKDAVPVTITRSVGAPIQTTTTAAGAYSVQVKPTQKTTFTASVAVDAGCAGATSPSKVVKVAKLVELTSSAARVRSGEKVTLTAEIAPCAGKAGQDVTLRRKKDDGTWAPVSTKQVNNSCTATWTQTISRKTTFSAVSPRQDPKHEAGTSDPVTVSLR